MQHKKTLEGLKDSPSLYHKRQSMNTIHLSQIQT